MSETAKAFCVLQCIPHDRLKKAWIVELAAQERELPVKTVLLQGRPSMPGANLGYWTVVGWDTNGRVLVEPMKGTRDNMLPGDRFFRIK